MRERKLCLTPSVALGKALTFLECVFDDDDDDDDDDDRS